MKKGRNSAGGQLRIIGGRWRSRKLRFPSAEGLRPSSDRGRETLFNWLQPYIENSRCLDLFAGSGALGLEALSRGADRVSLVEKAARVAQALRDNLQLLEGEGGEVIQADALAYLLKCDQVFDIVFLDPPFRKGLLLPCLQMLEERGLLADKALIYIEHEQEEPLPELPAHWALLRSKEAGQVAFHLAQRTG